MMRHRFISAAQRGQAAVELLVAAAFVLVPLFILAPLLGKYMDLQSSALQAARYAAFQRTVWSASGQRNGAAAAVQSNTDIATRTILRYFSIPGQGLSSSGNTLSAYRPNGLWVDQANHALLPKYSAIQVNLGPNTQTTDPALTAMQSTLGKLPATLPTLGYGGLFTAQVDAKPSPILYPPPFDTLALDFHAHDTLLTNGWTAVNSAQVVKQVQQSLPPGETSLGSTLSGLSGAFPDLSTLQLGHVINDTPAELPSDRYKP